MFLHNQLPTQGDHKAHAEAATYQRQKEDTCLLQREAKEYKGGQSKDHAASHRLTRRTSGLDDVVLQNAGLTQGAQDADGQNRDGNGGRNRQARSQPYINGYRTKNQSENATKEDSSERELGAHLFRRHVRLKFGFLNFRGYGFGHGSSLSCHGSSLA